MIIFIFLPNNPNNPNNNLNNNNNNNYNNNNPNFEDIYYIIPSLDNAWRNGGISTVKQKYARIYNLAMEKI
ncbi:hypothetical protein H8356DRAFT_1323958 [Neocallimastix lanati (nom. inval.)]|nr:hypothetical protein H8356DRAFT_1323958 [Neocallimastix sp. JGI-2020a]